MIKRPSRNVSEYRDPTKSWLDKNEVHDKNISQFVAKIIAKCPGTIFSSYPDLNQSYKKLSDFLGLPIECLYIGNGSDAIIKSVFENLVGYKETIFLRSPTFAMYDVYSTLFNSDSTIFPYNFNKEDFYFFWDVDLMEVKIVELKPKIIFLANPDSPTGTYLVSERLGEILKLAKNNCFVCIDLVYDEFSIEQFNYRKVISDYDNVVLIYSTSKSWGLAGIRLGFSIASPLINERLHSSRPMYEIGAIQAYIFENALNEIDVFRASIRRVLSNKEKIQKEIRNSKIRLVDTVGNFVIFEDDIDLVNELSIKNIIRNNWTVGPMKGLARMSISADMDLEGIIKTFKRF